MHINLNNEIRDFTYLSNVFKYTNKFGIMGHQVGRKVGDMLELITMGKIYKNKELLKRLDIEPKLIGATTAGHKVEFGFFHLNINNTLDKNSLFGSIECKKVGVEVTRNSKTRKKLLNILKNKEEEICFKNKWLSTPKEFTIKVNDILGKSVNILIKYSNNQSKCFTICENERFELVIDENETLHIIAPDENLYESIPTIMRICKSYQIEKVTNAGIGIRIWDWLTGPQTIEKAKQASLVAMDIRKEVDDKWGKDDIPESNKSIRSILIIGEFSHWEQKSINVVKKCIDYNLIVPDSVIIKAFKIFEKRFNNVFWDYINKDTFKNNEVIRKLIFEVIDSFDGKIFYNIETNKFVDFDFRNNNLIIFEL